MGKSSGEHRPSLAAKREGLAIRPQLAHARRRVPQMDLEIGTPSGCSPASIGAESRGDDYIVMPVIAYDLAAAGDVVDRMNEGVTLPATREQPPALRAEAQTAHHRPLPRQGAQETSVSPVPQPDLAGVIPACNRPVRRDREAGNPIAMTGHLRDLPAVADIAQPQIVVMRSRHRALPVRRQANGGD